MQISNNCKKLVKLLLHLSSIGWIPVMACSVLYSSRQTKQDKLGMCLSDCIYGKLARPALTVRKGQQLQIEWDGFTVHIDERCAG